jgi:hypothetical protein
MLDGTVSERVRAELSYDLYSGFYGDITHTISAKVNIPLFTPRVNLSLWMPIVEFYRNTQASFIHQQPLEPKMSGYEIGNVYISTDIHLLKQNKFTPDVSLRIAMITASGDGDRHARYFDVPGYFFDAFIAKSIVFNDGFFNELRFVASGGFLCWQVDKVTQNDAYMYGLKTVLSGKHLSSSIAWQGYTGWIGNGDRPMVIKADIIAKLKGFRPFIAYQYGIRDYPFHQFRIGLGYSF